MISLQHYIKGVNLNRGFVVWCKKLGINFGYVKVQGEFRPYKAKAMKRTELEKFIQVGREYITKYPRLNIADNEAGLVSLIKILERALETKESRK